MTSTPSLTDSEDSSNGAMLNPATPAHGSPYIDAQTYSLPPIDKVALPRHITGLQVASNSALPNVLDPNTATNLQIRHVCCIGAGYVGGPTAAVIALHNPKVRVTVVDRDERRIQAWKSKHLPIHEPGLNDIVRLARDGSRESKDANSESGSTRKPNLFFSTACAETLQDADMVLISVNTPTKLRGIGAGRATDMTAFEGAVRDVAINARQGIILVEKSTVPCKTGQLVKDVLEAYRPGIVFPVLSNPEFLSEGTAVRDLLQPDRLIIGCESTLSGHRAAAALVNLYAAWVPRTNIAPITIWSSELCKLVANAMLAQRISSINSISAICERTGADVNEVAKSIGSDARIGSQFLKAGLGFGGSCFRKDIASLTYLAESLGLPEVASYWQQVLTLNDFQRDRFAKHVISCLNNSLRGKKITILGFAFKKNTGDARESPALDVIRILLEECPRAIAIFDPLCSKADITRELEALGDSSIATELDGPVEIVDDPCTACADSSAILVLTDWDMFKVHRHVLPARVQFEMDQLEGAAPATILNLRRELVKSHPTPPTPPQTPKLSPLPSGLADRLATEPQCPTNCPKCFEAEQLGVSGKEASIPIDWQVIAQSVKEPRWVFDGRGILEARSMAEMGFRLETIGRASLH